MARQLEVTYTRSAIGRNARQRRTIQALGLRKLNDSVRHYDSPTIRGMIRKVEHLIAWRELEETPTDETA